MGLQSKPYFWITCDHPECGERSPGEGDEFSAWGGEMEAERYALDDDWQQRGDLWICPEHTGDEEEE
jgi:hypothetical protein